MSDRVGQQLGNYRIERLLARGGFGDVYLGEHIHLSIQAAIKVLNAQLVQNDVEQFRTEARTIARLIHPNIVRILEFGVEGSTPFLVMDYAPNGTLRQRHPNGTQVPLPAIVSYVKQISAALQFAHEQRLIHRDVKPENMLLGRSNEVLLSDFGIALIAQSTRYQGDQDMAGTIGYMAPEQIQAHPRPASDQYALGITVYEWLTGERPFHGSFTEIAVKHSVAQPPSLREKLPGISADLEHVVMTALAKDPQQRFASITAFAKALELASQTYETVALSDRSSVPLRPANLTAMAQEAHPKDAAASIRGELKENDTPAYDRGAAYEKKADAHKADAHKSTENQKQDAGVRQDKGVLTIRIQRPPIASLVAVLVGTILYSLMTARLYPLAFDSLILYNNPTPIIFTDLRAFDLSMLGSLIFFGFAEIVPLFLGSIFEPIVGLLTGGVGFFIGTYYSYNFRNGDFGYGGSNLSDYFGFYNQYHLSSILLYMALIGFVPGLVASLIQKRYPAWRTLSLLMFLNFAGVLLGAFLLVFLSNAVLHQKFTWQQLLLLVCMLPGLILLPCLLMAYEAIMKRVGRRVKNQSAVA